MTTNADGGTSTLTCTSDNLNEANTIIGDYEIGLKKLPLGHPRRSRFIHEYGIALGLRYGLNHNVDDLDQAILRFEESLSVTSNPTQRALRLRNLAKAIASRYDRTQDVNDLRRSVQAYHEAYSIIPDDDPGRIDLLRTFVLRSLETFKSTQVSSDLCLAIKWVEKLDEESLLSQTTPIELLQRLAAAYKHKFEATDDLEDLCTCIHALEDTVDIISEEHKTCKIDGLSQLGELYRIKYELTYEPNDLDHCGQRYEEAVSLAAKDSPHRLTLYLGLARAYKLRYLSDHDLTDLENHIHCCQEAWGTPRDPKPEQERNILNILSSAHHLRHFHTGALADVESSIRFRRRALELEEYEIPRAVNLVHLSVSLEYRYAIRGNWSDKQEADRITEEIDHMCEKYGQELKTALYGILGWRPNKHGQLQSVEEIRASIKHQQEAMNVMRDGDPAKLTVQFEMSERYFDIYLETEDLKDLDQSIKHCEESLTLAPEYYHSRANLLFFLGQGYRLKGRLLGIQEATDTGKRCLSDALDHRSSTPLDRLQAGYVLLEIHAKAKEWMLAADTASRIMLLMPQRRFRCLDPFDFQTMIKSSPEFVSDAVAVYLKAGKSPYEALQVLETARGLTASSLSDLRIDTRDLEAKHPSLAKQFNQVRSLLEQYHDGDIKGSVRYSAGKRLEESIAEIRTLPGFDGFLLAPTIEDMKSAARRGSIIVINISKYGCDAIIIEQDGLRTLELPFLKVAEVQARSHTLSHLDIDTLEWLWSTTTQPILEALNITKPSSETWPRCWWITTGALMGFPLHASGDYSDPELHLTVMDRVISSYSSSVRAIVEHNPQHVNIKPTYHQPKSITIVSMAETPGQSSLPFASAEATIVASTSTFMNIQTTTPPTTSAAVLHAITHTDIFHFAGHGYSDANDPSQSSLALTDGNLTVSQVFNTNLHHKPRLAYLSACSTGQVRSARFIDEAIHLISAWQLAGFRHVIGTLWAVNDESCVEIARRTYQHFLQRGFSDGSIAEGLHCACRALRDEWMLQWRQRRQRSRASSLLGRSCGVSAKGPRDIEVLDDEEEEMLAPLFWVPYVHFGP